MPKEVTIPFSLDFDALSAAIHRAFSECYADQEGDRLSISARVEDEHLIRFTIWRSGLLQFRSVMSDGRRNVLRVILDELDRQSQAAIEGRGEAGA